MKAESLKDSTVLKLNYRYAYSVCMSELQVNCTDQS